MGLRCLVKCVFSLVNCVPCEDPRCSFCPNLRNLLYGGRMKQYVDSDKWGRWHVSYYMSDDGAGFKSYVMEDHPTARRLKYWQHVGNKYLIWPNCCFLSKFVIDVWFGFWWQKLRLTNGLIARFSLEVKQRLIFVV